MIRPKRSLKYPVEAALVILAAAGVTAAVYPPAVRTVHDRSVTMVQDGDQLKGAQAEAQYRLAVTLWPANQHAYIRLAEAQIASGRPQEAIRSLDRAGKGSEASRLRLRLSIELGQYNEAARLAALITESTPDDDILAALAYGLARRDGLHEILAARQSSAQTAARILRAGAGGQTLAAELYAARLPQSSSAILTKLPSSYERDLLLARILHDRHTRQSFARAAEHLKSAIAHNPSSIDARELLADIYRQQKRQDELTLLEATISNLRNGRP